MVDEVEQFVVDGPTTLELRRAKAQFERHWLHELARIDSRADAFGEYATLLGDPDLVNRRISQIEAVTDNDIALAVQQWFGTDYRATLVYHKSEPDREPPAGGGRDEEQS
jgi:predicted Zn-dependent peptidase